LINRGLYRNKGRANESIKSGDYCVLSGHGVSEVKSFQDRIASDNKPVHLMLVKVLENNMSVIIPVDKKVRSPSFGERKMFDRVLDLMINEVALVKNLSKENVKNSILEELEG
jgi:RNA polymerase-interacting CarD/CdnL/TRCF family regulator